MFGVWGGVVVVMVDLRGVESRSGMVVPLTPLLFFLALKCTGVLNELTIDPFLNEF